MSNPNRYAEARKLHGWLEKRCIQCGHVEVRHPQARRCNKCYGELEVVGAIERVIEG